MREVFTLIAVIGGLALMGVTGFISDQLGKERNTVLVIHRTDGTKERYRIGKVVKLPLDKMGKLGAVEIVGSRGSINVATLSIEAMSVEIA